MNKPFIIPQSPKSLLAKVENGRITIEKTIDIPFNSISKVTDNNLIVSLCHEPYELRIFDKTGKLIIKKEKGFKYKALAIKGNVVYLGGIYTGGDYKGEMFSIIDLNNPGILIEDIKLPIKAVKGKAIDDILILDNKLILVDNIIFPKYLLEFDISVPTAPYHISTKLLPDGGTHEHIIKGDVNKDWLVIFSSGFSRDYDHKMIIISGKTNGWLTSSKYRGNEGNQRLGMLYNNNIDFSDIDKLNAKYDKQQEVVQPKENPATIRDICLVDNYLFILRHDGLVYIDLNRKIDNSEFKKIKTKSPTYEKFIKTENNEIIVVDESSYELV